MLVYQRVTLKYSLHVPVVFHMSRLAETKIGLLWRSHKNVRMCQDMVTFFGSSYGTSNHYIVLMSFYSVFYIYIYILYIYNTSHVGFTSCVCHPAMVSEIFPLGQAGHVVAMLWGWNHHFPSWNGNTLESNLDFSRVTPFFRYVLTFKISTFWYMLMLK